ncbi:hypothetical protein QYM36_010544 [Artemia franciscana]|uniref:Uncharacterized protein n=1 Tax=Artemia franciscana TaxID=6661 RepID=A0AA88LC62_ARTSF|nr:hypothetical protein QYM36_010544 [Artemia franciscana]
MHSTYVRMQLERQRSRRAQLSQRPLHRTFKKRMRTCCRQLTAFLFSQVGICSLLLGYTVVGAFSFMVVEEGVAMEIALQVEGLFIREVSFHKDQYEKCDPSPKENQIYELCLEANALSAQFMSASSKYTSLKSLKRTRNMIRRTLEIPLYYEEFPHPVYVKQFNLKIYLPVVKDRSKKKK